MSSRIGRILLQQSRRTFVGRPTPIVFLPPSCVSRAVGASAQDAVVARRWFSDKTASEEKKAEPTEESSADTAAKEGVAPPPPPAEEAAAPPGPSKEEQLEAQVKELKDQLLRSLAEQDNTRRIAQRDVDAASQFAIKSFAKALLDTSDNLTRALDAVPEEMRHDKENHTVLANLYEGIEMTGRGLIKAFEMNGLVKFGKEGELFDPNKHEALYEYVDPEKKVGTIGQIMKPGFMLRDRVLRPAEVGVIKKE
mmetsp:Transcript_9428/g.18032  ORF Transcript_9428/g.18032 Transcript_9428/m.18032 type:complete len:252 (-) Transcript_9428:114-869(-)|eukprot:scaffold9279_cov159-Amphora_coffeaeformis.AAC.3